VATITAMIPFRLFIFEYASPRASYTHRSALSTRRVRLFHEAPGRRSRY
jgi:hypothetical protein